MHYLFIAFMASFLFTACGDETSSKPDSGATPDENTTDNAVTDNAVTDEIVTDDTLTDDTLTDTAVTDDDAVIATCGNGEIDEGEPCDGDAQDCTVINSAYVGGNAECKSDCSGYNTATCALDPLVSHLVGVWAQKVELFADGNVPVVNEVVVRTDKIVRIVIKEEGGKAVLSERPLTCYMETVIVEGNAIAKTITTYFPEKFRNYFTYIAPEALKDPKPALEYSGTPQDFSFKMNKWWEMRGAYFQGENGTQPFDIETEMVTDKNDPRIFDQDEDGKAGETFEITSSIASGLVWGVIKSYMEITTDSASGERAEGSAQWQQTEMVIDTDNSLFAGDRTIVPHTQGNTMIMVKVDAAMDCDAIDAQKDTLFK